MEISLKEKIVDWDEYKAKQKKGRDENYARAMEHYETARDLATENGFALQQHSTWHFSLTCVQDGKRKWRFNLYPSNQRIYWDRKCGKAPFLNLPKPWTFLDVVSAAIIQVYPTPQKLLDAIRS